MQKYIKFLLVLLLIPLLWFGFQYWSITTIGENSQPQEADVIIILGAAVWPNGPSPALQARVYHGATIFQEGFAPEMIVTGGLGSHPPTEAEAMHQILLDLGVDSSIIHLEDRAKNTKENLAFSKKIMEDHGWQSAIIVTDFFHLKRALLFAEDNGIEAYGSPAKNGVLYHRKDLRMKYTFREVLAISQYYWHRLIGY